MTISNTMLTEAQRTTLTARKTKLQERLVRVEAALERAETSGGVTQDSFTSAAGGTRSSSRASIQELEEIVGRLEMRIAAIDRVLDGNNAFETVRIVAVSRNYSGSDTF